MQHLNTYSGYQPSIDSLAPTAGPIYLDYNATTPIDPRVANAMIPYLCKHWGNPSSSHVYGQAAKRGVDKAREQVAKALGTQPKSILFTSGGTESANHAIKGAVARKKMAMLRATSGNGIGSSNMNNSIPVGHTAYSWGSTGSNSSQSLLPHVITSITEHPCVLQVCEHLANTNQITLTVLNVNEMGQININDIEKSVCKETALVTIMHSNNESGVIQDIATIAKVARETSKSLGGDECGGILIHTDASQSMGKVKLDVKTLNVDLLTLAGHKVYAPKGVGCLFMKEGSVDDFPVFMHGAGHENGRRAGTENVLLVAGFGEGCEIANNELADNDHKDHLINMSTMLYNELNALCSKDSDGNSQLRINGPPLASGNAMRLPNTLNIGFNNVTSDELMNGNFFVIVFVFVFVFFNCPQMQLPQFINNKVKSHSPCA
jgi:cysteine desulfurase